MKKVRVVFIMALAACGALQACDHECFSGLLSAGYVFKSDCTFKQMYGHGMVDVITADGCYYPWQMWGIGAKVSYWRAHGTTLFLNRSCVAQEVPVTVYARLIQDFCCGVQTYISFGGGFAWIKEKSCRNRAHTYKGIGEVEAGLSYSFCRCVDIVTAFRYLFPRQSQCGKKIDVGGCDLRAGIGFSF